MVQDLIEGDRRIRMGFKDGRYYCEHISLRDGWAVGVISPRSEVRR